MGKQLPDINTGSNNTSGANNVSTSGLKQLPTLNNEFQGKESNTQYDLNISKYTDYIDTVYPNQDIDEQRAQSQSSISKLSSGLANAATGVLFDTLGGASYLLDFQQHANLIKGTETEFGNWFSNLMDSAKESTHLDVYRTKESEGFSPGSAGWWADAIPSIASTVSLLIPGEAATMALGKAGKLLGGTKMLKALGAGKNEVNLMKNINRSVASRYMENTMEAADTYKQTESKLRGQINPETGTEYNEDEIKQLSGEAARNTWYSNLAMLPLDIYQYRLAFKGFEGAKQAKKMHDFTLKDLAKEMITEGGEEAYQFIASQEAINKATKDPRSFDERLESYLEDGDFWTGVFLGSIGGGVFSGATGVLRNKEVAQRNKLQAGANDLVSMHKAVIEGDKESFTKASDNAFIDSVLTSIQSGNIDKYKEDIKSLLNTKQEELEGEEFNDPDFYTKVNERVSDLDFVERAYYNLTNSLETNDTIKGIKLSALLNERVTNRRKSKIETALNQLYSEDQIQNKYDLELLSLKRAKIDSEITGNKDVYKQLLKNISDTRDITQKELEDSIKSSNDFLLTSISKVYWSDVKDLEDIKKILKDTETDKGKEEIIKKAEEQKAKQEVVKKENISKVTKEYQKDKYTSDDIKNIISQEEDKDIVDSLNKILEDKLKVEEELTAKEKDKVKAVENEISKLEQELNTESISELKSKEIKDKIYDLKNPEAKKERLSNEKYLYDNGIHIDSDIIYNGQTHKVDNINLREGKAIIKQGNVFTEVPIKDIQSVPKPIAVDLIQDTVSETMHDFDNSIFTEKTVDNQDTLLTNKGYDYISFTPNKSIGSISNVIMYKEYEHEFKGKSFRWVRDELGLPLNVNITDVDVEYVNNNTTLKPGDEITFKLEPTSKEYSKLAVDESIDIIKRHIDSGNEFKYSKEDNYGFGNYEPIGIYREDKLIGYIQLPHFINEKLAEIKNINIEHYINARNEVIEKRKQILDLLKNNQEVKGNILYKGTGTLITKLTDEGKVDVFKDEEKTQYRNLLDDDILRPIDLVEGKAVFVYNNGTSLVLANHNITNNRELENINTDLLEFNNWGKKGQAFVLIRSANNTWYPVPIYVTPVNNKVADKISDIVVKFKDFIDQEIAKGNRPDIKILSDNLNKYIYTSTDNTKKGAAVLNYKTDFGGNTFVEIKVNGETFNLDTLANIYRFKEFLIKNKVKQNFLINSINRDQEELKENGTLTTNIHEVNGSYFAQPILKYTLADSSINEVDANLITGEVINTNKSFDDLFGTIDTSEEESDGDYANKVKDKDSNLFENDKEVTKWLKNNLPGLTREQYEDLAKTKDLLVDSWGVYKDFVISVAYNADKGTTYHEAFHGVFRNILTDVERVEILIEAKKNYNKPTDNDLASIQNRLRSTYTKPQLETLYYEEKLADDFADYIDTYQEMSLGKKILEFFKRLLRSINVIINNRSKIDSLFEKINTGKYSKQSVEARKLFEDNKLAKVNLPLNNEYAYSQIKGFKAEYKQRLVTTIGNEVLNRILIQYNNNVNVKDINIDNIFKDIENYYKQYGVDNFNSLPDAAKKDLKNIIVKFDEFKQEALKFINSKGFKVKNNTIENNEQSVDMSEEEIDPELDLNGQTTKGFNEITSIPGLKSSSTRLKLFLAGIPTYEKVDGKYVQQKDIFGLPIYQDFHKLYYYIEQNLIDVYDYNEMLNTLQELSINKPELNDVIYRLNNGYNNMSNEELNRLRNDFKSNFSKQQLAFGLVLYDTDSVTGKVSYKIMDSNRQTLVRQLYDNWNNNLNDSSKTVSEYLSNGEIKQLNTNKAKSLFKEWENKSKLIRSDLKRDNKKPSIKELDRYLRLIGIELSPITLEKLVNEKPLYLVNTIDKALGYIQNPQDRFESDQRKIYMDLAKEEAKYNLSNYTSSFISADRKNIYTIQLPSFASKLLTKLKKNFDNTYSELTADKSYLHSNILTEMQNNKELFKMIYSDGLTDEKGSKEGVKFNKMSPKDYLAFSIAMFNNSNNKIGKYVYLTPSDKNMLMMFDFVKYNRQEITSKYYNLFLQEAERIKQQLFVKEMYLNETKDADGNVIIKKKDLLYKYHAKNDISKFDGNAYKFTYFEKLNDKDIYDKIISSINDNDNLNEAFKNIEGEVLNIINNELEVEIKNAIDEAVEKGIIGINDKGLYNIALDVNATYLNNNDIDENQRVKNFITDFALNQRLFLSDASKLLNGDPAFYKSLVDLGKRTYQSGAMTIYGNVPKNDIVRTILVSDVSYRTEFLEQWKKILESQGYSKDEIDFIVGNYEGNDKEGGTNVTDAQVYCTPEFYKKFKEQRGQWTKEDQLAHDVAEGIVDYNSLSINDKESIRGLINGLKPFYFGNRFDEKLGIQVYEQVKCAVLPLYKSYIKMNPLLAKQRDLMDKNSVDMLAHESSFKASQPYKTNLRDLNEHGYQDRVLNLDMNNFGIQVDNPDHSYESDNSSLRQTKMLLKGNINPTHIYNDGRLGKLIQDEITDLESANIYESLTDLLNAINGDKVKFAEFINTNLTRRNATDNLAKKLEIDENGKFKYPIESTELENLLSSMFSKDVILQKFRGGSLVQATSLGIDFKTLGDQQKAIDKDPALSKWQSELKHVRETKDGKTIDYVEAILPAWAEAYFDENGNIKTDIPEELKELIIYRIPTEGYHSMLHVRAKAFLPAEFGNFILLPYEITTQFGADFDFDKIYFIVPEFYTDKKTGKLHKVKYNEDKGIKGNSREARNNRIFDNYLTILKDKDTFAHTITPSGFDKLKESKEAIEKEDTKQSKYHFFSGIEQRQLKERNHVGAGLKGQSANHVTAHAQSIMMGLLLDEKSKFVFNNNKYESLSDLKRKDSNSLIADELSSMMAAILDDIKDPLLKTLGINAQTLDLWASIVRVGAGTETAINFITQPVVQDIATLLIKNNDQIKELGFKYQSKNDINAFFNLVFQDKLNKITEVSPELSDKINNELKYIKVFNLNDTDLVKWRVFEKRHRDDIKSMSEDFIKNTPELADYFIFQMRVLNNWSRYQKVADELVKLNKLLAINKEVGPNMENIISKQIIYQELKESTVLINATNLTNDYAAYMDTHLNTMKIMSEYFPYSSVLYNKFKQDIVSLQSANKKAFDEEDRMKINQFISTFLGYRHFNNLISADRKNYLMKDLGLKIANIKNYNNDEKYGKLRNNLFINALKVEKGKLKGANNYIYLNGQKLEPQVKDSITEALYSLYNNKDTKELAIDLIEYSYLSSGYYVGYNSYHNLIPVEILDDLKFTDFKKRILEELNDNTIQYTDKEYNIMIDQFIRNNVKKFTKVFEQSKFEVVIENNLPYQLKASSFNNLDLVTSENEETGEKEYIKYIRVFDAKLNRPILYRLSESGKEYASYTMVNYLGKSGKFVEINPTENIIESIEPANNNIFVSQLDKINEKYASVNNEPEYTPYEEVPNNDIKLIGEALPVNDPTDEIDAYLVEPETTKTKEIANVNSLFGDVTKTKTFEEVYNNFEKYKTILEGMDIRKDQIVNLTEDELSEVIKKHCNGL